MCNRFEKKSKTFGKSFKIILSEKNCLSLYIPEGFAHAYFSYDKVNVVYYKLKIITNLNMKDGINLMDKKIKINWPRKNVRFQKKIKIFNSFREFCNIHKSL